MADIIQRPTGLRALNQWTAQVGIDPRTAARMRKRGWLSVINIAGRLYISEGEIARFTARAEAGEFSKARHTPITSKAVLP